MGIKEARLVSEVLKVKFGIDCDPVRVKILSRKGELNRLTKGDKVMENAIRDAAGQTESGYTYMDGSGSGNRD